MAVVTARGGEPVCVWECSSPPSWVVVVVVVMVVVVVGVTVARTLMLTEVLMML